MLDNEVVIEKGRIVDPKHDRAARAALSASAPGRHGAAMQIEDSFVVAAPRERVWAAITDPGADGGLRARLRMRRGDRARRPTGRCVKIELGPIKAHVQSRGRGDRGAAALARSLSVTRGEEGTRASSSRPTNELELRSPATGDRPRSRYTSEVSVVGRLGKFGLGVMKKKAESARRKTSRQTFRARVESEAAGERARGCLHARRASRRP